MSDLTHHAQKLAEALEESMEFQHLKQAYEQVLEDETSKALFQRFRENQSQLQQKQQQGLEITEKEIEKSEAIALEIKNNKKLSHLIAMEQLLYDQIEDLSRMITKPLEELYES